ncbi:MAG: WD40/YVTN/BNR-like repeat-containing protein [Gemmatimonadaceae bacterium]
MSNRRPPHVPGNDHAPSARDDTREGSAFSRRDFLFRAGAAGIAASAVRPLLSPGLPAQPAPRGIEDSPFGAGAPARLTRRLSALDLGLRWRMLGPFRGGRVDAVTGVPGRPNEFYFGAVNGGVWKSIDAGRVWTPVFDSQPVASIGAIAVAPSAPDTVYVGTGESTLRDSMGFGNGVYKTTDAGRSWTHLGLDATHHIGKIAVDPKDANTLFVAAIGQLYAPNAERGVFRSRDGGKSWQKVLFKNNDVGAVDVAIDPTDSRVVYASLWNTRRPPWYTYQPSNGPGGGLYKSTDGGSTWKQMTSGLPAEGIGRSGIAIAPSDPRRVYAVIDDLLPEPGAVVPPAAPAAAAPGGFGRGPQVARQGGFFRSDDAGATWTRVSSDQALWGRGWYFEKVAVDPKDADIVYVPNVAVSRTKDGGKTWAALRGSPGGDDYHQAWISPDDTNTMIVASDQGAIITRNATADDPRTVTWSSWLNQPTAQIYHLSVDPRSPYWVTGAQQDSGAVAVRVRGKFGEISMRDWEPIGAGGESGFTAGDPLHPGIIYGGMGGRFDLEANADVPGTSAPRSTEPLRADWTQPLVLSRADPRNLYYAAQFLFKSSDSAATWKQVSPDLTRPAPGVPATLDAAAAADTDRNGQRGVIYAVCPSPLLVPMIWAGTDDGLVHVTLNDGKSWTDVTPPAVTAWSRVTCVEASHFDFNAAYISVDRHQLQDFEPYLYRTRDQGKTWQKITKGLPAGVYVHAVKEDPSRQGLLVAGTERGAFISFDDGDTWQSLQLNLPVTSVRDFEFHDGDLVVATHGRGFWVIDDISPLRQLTDAVLAAEAWLFKPSDVTNYTQGGDNGTPLQKDEPQALNPPSGVAIDYYLKSTVAAPVTLEILDAAGAVVGSFSSASPSAATGRAAAGGIPNTSPLWRPDTEPFSAAAGMHRVVWNTSGRRGGFGGGGGRGAGAAPFTGTFTARLTVNGTATTQSFTVHPDPRR